MNGGDGGGDEDVFRGGGGDSRRGAGPWIGVGVGMEMGFRVTFCVSWQPRCTQPLMGRTHLVVENVRMLVERKQLHLGCGLNPFEDAPAHAGRWSHLEARFDLSLEPGRQLCQILPLLCGLLWCGGGQHVWRRNECGEGIGRYAVTVQSGY